MAAYKVKKCKVCQVSFKPTGSKQKYCKPCGKLQREIYLHNYRRKHKLSKERRKEVRQKYDKKHREQIRIRNRLYRKSIVGHLQQVFYNLKKRIANPTGRNACYTGIKNKFESLDEFRDYVVYELQIDPRGLQIDRIDNNGHYERGNIRFVTAKENSNNRGENV